MRKTLGIGIGSNLLKFFFDNDSEREPTSAIFMPENSLKATPTTAKILPIATEATDTTTQSHR